MNLTRGVDRYPVCKKVKLKGGNKIFWKWNEKIFFFFIILERINFRYEFFLNNSNRNRNVYSEIVEQCKKEKKNR